jgi:hypothetical protein
MTTDIITSSESCDELAETANQVTTDEARTRLEDTLFSALESAENRLIDAPTSLGKSYQTATTRWREFPEVTGDSLVIHVHQTRTARDAAVEESEDADGVSCHVLEGRVDSCPTASGDHDGEFTAPDGSTPSEWFDRKCDGDKVPFSVAHRVLNAKRGLPCMADSECPSRKQWWTQLRDKDGSLKFDVVHTTANFAHVPELIDGANVVFDERPRYSLTLNDTQRQHFRDSLSNLLAHRSGGDRAMLDIETAVLRDRPELRDELRSLLQGDVDDEWYFRRAATHRLAPEIGLAMLNAEEIIADEWSGTDADFSGRWMGEHQGVRVVLDSQANLRYVHHQPDFSEARCVVGLDAFPSVYRWRQNTVKNLTRVDVLSQGERRRWRREERGLKVVQVGDATRSYTNGWKSAGEERAGSIIHALRGKHGAAFGTCISSQDTRSDVWRMMERVGIEEPRMMHYGAQNSRNDFKKETVGLLIGCIDPGDKTILDLLALGGRCAQPELITTEAGETKRKPGRSFVGQDADIADEILRSVREMNLAQGAGRYARRPDSDESSALVYVWSDACPDSLTDEVLTTSFKSVTPKRENIIKELQKQSFQTTRELSESVGVDKTTAYRCMKMCEEYDAVTKREETGADEADEWRWTGGNIRTLVELN